MIKILKISLLLFTCFLFTCESTDPNHLEEDNLHAKLMEVHDEVMPKMGEINSLRKKLIKHAEANSVSEVDAATINEAIMYLEQADEAMMDWMGDYKKPSKLRGDKTHEEILSYLKAEKIKIEQVKYDMLTSISAASELIEKHDAAQ